MLSPIIGQLRFLDTILIWWVLPVKGLNNINDKLFELFRSLNKVLVFSIFPVLFFISKSKLDWFNLGLPSHIAKYFFSINLDLNKLPKIFAEFLFLAIINKPEVSLSNLWTNLYSVEISLIISSIDMLILLPPWVAIEDHLFIIRKSLFWKIIDFLKVFKISFEILFFFLKIILFLYLSSWKFKIFRVSFSLII